MTTRAELDAEWKRLCQLMREAGRHGFAQAVERNLATERAIVDREQQIRISELEAKIAAQAREMQGISDYVGVGMTNQIRERWQRDQRKQQAAAIRWAASRHTDDVSFVDLANWVERGDVKVEQ